MSENATDNGFAAYQIDGFQSYREVCVACHNFVARANEIERHANEATRGVRRMMLRQIQLARAIDDVLEKIHDLSEHYKHMDFFGDELLLPHNYILSDRMMNANVQENYLWMTEDFLRDARKGLQKANELVDAQEYMEQRRDQVHEAVGNIKRLTNATTKLSGDLSAFVPRLDAFFHKLNCGCNPDQACSQHEWEPQRNLNSNIRQLDNKTKDILANLDDLLQKLASDAGKRAASPRGEHDGEDPLAGVFQAGIDRCVIGGCAVCGKEDHATAACPLALAAVRERGAELREDGLYLMGGALQEDDDKPVTSDTF